MGKVHQRKFKKEKRFPVSKVVRGQGGGYEAGLWPGQLGGPSTSQASTSPLSQARGTEIDSKGTSTLLCIIAALPLVL